MRLATNITTCPTAGMHHIEIRPGHVIAVDTKPAAGRPGLHAIRHWCDTNDAGTGRVLDQTPGIVSIAAGPETMGHIDDYIDGATLDDVLDGPTGEVVSIAAGIPGGGYHYGVDADGEIWRRLDTDHLWERVCGDCRQPIVYADTDDYRHVIPTDCSSYDPIEVG